MNDSFTYSYSFYLRETYFQTYIGKFLQLEGENSSEVITAASVLLITISFNLMKIKVIFNTTFNTRQFEQLVNIDNGLENLESGAKLMVKDIDQYIVTPNKEFCPT
jgi:type IV secretory pathway VirB6-like protein